MTIEITNVMAPYAVPLLDGEALPLKLAGFAVTKSMVQPGGTLELTLVDNEPIELAALTRFAEAPASERPMIPIALGLGYRDGLAPATIFSGWVSRFAPLHEGRVIQLEALDDLPLRIDELVVSGKDTSAKELVESALVEMAEDVDFDIDIPTAPLQHNVSDKRSVLDVLGDLKQTANIPFTWFFTVDGRLIWKPWIPPAGERYVFEYKKNIVQLEPDNEDLAVEEPDTPVDEEVEDEPSIVAWQENRPKGPVYRLSTIPHPWIEPGHVVRVSGHPRAVDGEYRVDTAEHYVRDRESRSIFSLRRLAA